jgi:hypothetical protein
VRPVMVHRLAGPGGGEDAQRFAEHLTVTPVIDLLTGLG